MIRIKICGLSRPEDIDYVNQLSVDYIGFIFAPKSRRCVTPAKALLLRQKLNPRITPVGVFVNEPLDQLFKIVSTGVADVIQLHGQEDDAYIASLRQMVNLPIIKAYSIGNFADIEKASASTADYILLDSGTGGTGTSFDWNLLHKINRPYFLAGGLTPENIQLAMSTRISDKADHLRLPDNPKQNMDLAPANPPLTFADSALYAVDVSSGVETGGYKDFAKMKQFVECVNNQQSPYERKKI